VEVKQNRLSIGEIFYFSPFLVLAISWKTALRAADIKALNLHFTFGSAQPFSIFRFPQPACHFHATHTTCYKKEFLFFFTAGCEWQICNVQCIFPIYIRVYYIYMVLHICVLKLKLCARNHEHSQHSRIIFRHSQFIFFYIYIYIYNNFFSRQLKRCLQSKFNAREKCILFSWSKGRGRSITLLLLPHLEPYFMGFSLWFWSGFVCQQRAFLLGCHAAYE